MEFVKWPKIGQLHNVRKDIKSRIRYHEVEGLDPFVPPVVRYKSKIKLDGTNAAIRVCGDKFAAQSRSRTITPQDDNMGFAAWAHSSEWVKSLRFPSEVTIFGEWAGPGVQKRTAVSKVSEKIFAVFAVLVEDRVLITSPASIDLMLPGRPSNVHVLPWEDFELEVDFGSRANLEAAAEEANKAVEVVEKCDPWVKRNFDIEGLGEGLVYYPQSSVDIDFFSDYAFKAKGEEHQVVKQKAPVIVDVEKVASVKEFASKFVTEARLLQGLREACENDAHMRNTGAFLRWFGNDVKSESGDELEAAGLEWKDVAKEVNAQARDWWMAKCREI